MPLALCDCALSNLNLGALYGRKLSSCELQVAGLPVASCRATWLQLAAAAAITTLAWLIEFHFVSNLHDPAHAHLAHYPSSPTEQLGNCATCNTQGATSSLATALPFPLSPSPSPIACVPHIWQSDLEIYVFLAHHKQRGAGGRFVCATTTPTARLESNAICLCCCCCCFYCCCLPHENSAK